MSEFLRDLALVVAIAIAVGAVLGARHLADRIDRLQARVACLERPHGESSIAGRMVDGRFVPIGEATRTGCAAVGYDSP